MNGPLHRNPHGAFPGQFFLFALLIGILITLAVLVLYAYLGTFARYTSDDYCLSAFFLRDELLNAMIKRCLNASNRYTNILFIGLADGLFGWYNVAILPALMLGLFVLGLYFLLKEISKGLQLRWNSLVVLFLSLFFVFFSISQAPDLYETLYWRAGMTSHFAPLVFMPFWGAFLIRQVRKAREQSPFIWIQALCFVMPFIIGGLSEPPTALMITILFLAIAAAWLWSDAWSRRSILILLGWSLAGAVAAVPVGRWLDRHGGRALMTGGSILATLLVVAWSQVRTVGQLYAVWLALGVVSGRMARAMREGARQWRDYIAWASGPEAGVLAMLMIAGPAELWDQDLIDGFIESLR